jgi:hypothetical protein
MPRDGSITSSDLATERLAVACKQCGRRGSYSVARLMSQHGDARLPDLRQEQTVDRQRKTAHGLHN